MTHYTPVHRRPYLLRADRADKSGLASTAAESTDTALPPQPERVRRKWRTLARLEVQKPDSVTAAVHLPASCRGFNFGIARNLDYVRSLLRTGTSGAILVEHAQQYRPPATLAENSCPARANAPAVASPSTWREASARRSACEECTATEHNLYEGFVIQLGTACTHDRPHR